MKKIPNLSTDGPDAFGGHSTSTLQQHLKMNRILSFLGALALTLGTSASAATVAYWRFEAGPEGASVARGGQNAGVFYPGVADSSGNGHALSAWDAGGAGYTYRTNDVSGVPQGTNANHFSVQNSGDYPAMWTDPAGGLTTWNPAVFTIEVSYKPENGNYRTFVGRDSRGTFAGNPDAAAMYFQLHPNNAVVFQFIDNDGNLQVVTTGAGAVTGWAFPNNPGLGLGWYNFAAVSDGTTLNLYINGILAASANMGAGNHALGLGAGSGGDWTAGEFTVGRGLYAGGHGDRAYGLIDEVRFSDTALTPAEFLFPPPAITHQIWNGKTAVDNGTWDVGTTANWLGNGTIAGPYANGLATIFNDSAAGTTAVTQTTNTTPFSLTVSNHVKNYTFTGAGSISGVALIKQGTGALTLGSSNNFGGPSQIQNGTLVLTAPTTFSGEGELWIGNTTNSGATLVISNTTVTVNNNYLAIGRGNGANGYISTLTLTNANLSCLYFSVGWDGGLAGNNASQVINVLGNSVFHDHGRILLGESPGSTGTLVVANSSVLNKPNEWFAIGSYGVGFLTLKDNASLTNGGDFNVSDVGASQGTLTLQDSAVLTLNGDAFVGKNTGTIGTWNQSGGTANANAYFSIGRYAGASGTVTVSGGALNQLNPANIMLVGEAGTGVLTIGGSGSVNCTNFLSVGAVAGASGTINLDGGTLVAKAIQSGNGASTLNFNGGTLKATAGASAAFMAQATTAFLSPGGAMIDSAGNDITIDSYLNDNGGALTKLGSGTLTLTAGNAYAGATTVSGGKLALTTATAGTGSYTVANGAALGLTVLSALAQVNPSALTLDTATLDIDLGAFGNPTNYAPWNVTAALAVNGTVTVNIADALPQVGLCPLLTYGSTTGAGSFALGTVPLGVVAHLVTIGNTLFLNITAVNLPRWEGLAGGDWDVNLTTNWMDLTTGLPTKFAQGNAAVFDDLALGTNTVNLVTTVTPGSVTVNNSSLNYSLTGAGKISGSAGLRKQGTGFLTNTTPSDYTGPTTLEGGTLVATTLANYGSGSSIGASNLVFAGGALSYLGPNVSIDRGYSVAGGGTLDLQSDLTLGGRVAAASGNFTKTGAGTLTLTAATTNNYLSAGGGGGAYVITGGKVVLDGTSGQTNNVKGEVWIGQGPGNTGELAIINGAQFVSDGYNVAGRQGGTGTINITNSTLTHLAVNNDLIVGSDPGSVGVLNLAGTSVVNDNWGWLLIGSGGGTGTFNQSGGTLKVNAQGWQRLRVGQGAGSIGTYNLSGGTATVGDRIYVGTEGATGTALLGGGTITAGGDLRVGVENGQGTMALTNFAALTYGGWGTIGGNTEQDASASVGIVTLASNCTWTGGGRLYVGVRQGTGTLQVNSATLTAGNDLHVGVQAGTGSLTLSGTAALVQTAGWSFIGGNFDAAHSGVGTVTLQDSATLTTPGNFYLGFWGGNGTLNIGNNAALNKNGGGVFDIGDGAIGVVNQSGGTLTTGGELWVGNVGGATGTYNLSGGALTMNNWFSIGRDNANGTVNMTGGTLTKKGGGNVEIGSFGGNPHSGTVTLSGGLFDVQAGEIVMGLNVAVGTLNLNGGTLKVSRISGSTGTSTVHLNGGTNLATANQPAYLGGLTAVTVLPNGAIIDDGGFTIGIAQALLGDPAGDGGLTKLGNGTLALNGVNTYTNTTTVAAGTLSGRGTFAGPVTVAAGATLAPGASLGALTISNVLTLAAGSQTYIELNKTAVTNDQVLGTTAVTYGGTLILKNLAGQLVAGDTFTLFPVGTRTGAFAAVVSQTLGQTVAWDLSMLTVDGTVKVATAVALPVHLASSAGNGQLHLGWPLDQTGWLLQSQTNALVVGLGTNWVDVAGSTATNQMNFPIGPTPGAAFYRLVLP